MGQWKQNNLTLTKTWPSAFLSAHPPSLRPRLQHAPRQCESMWGGIWETKGQPHDVSHTDSDRQEQALVCVQRGHHYWVPGQRSWLVNTSCLCLWTHKLCPGFEPSAGSNLIGPTRNRPGLYFVMITFVISISASTQKSWNIHTPYVIVLL